MVELDPEYKEKKAEEKAAKTKHTPAQKKKKQKEDLDTVEVKRVTHLRVIY
jgi:hypothetical protein